MIQDIGTVFWKESRELFLQAGSVRKTIRSLLFSLAVFGIFLPWQFGRSFVDSPAALMPWLWVPFLMISGVVADSFAGERERHTLETLLASRLPDPAILLGKIALAVAYGWGFAIVSAFVGIVTVNVLDGHGELIFYTPDVLAGLLGFGLLGAGLMAGAGVLVSLRAATLRQAAQSMSIAIMALLFIPIIAFQVLPEDWRVSLLEALAGLNGPLIALVAALSLVAADAIVLVAASARFKRARLLLD